MRIATWNVNGLRAALKKGFADHLSQLAPDILMLQEVRSLPEQLADEWAEPIGWNVHWQPAEKKGYSGTAVWSRGPMELIGTGIPGDNDREGRITHVVTCPHGDNLQKSSERIQIISTYLPSGSSSPERQAIKEQWMERFMPWAEELARSKEAIIIGGDLNIAHTTRDIFHAKSNEKTSGFLPHEREWFGRLLDAGWTDFVREQFGDVDGPYSWWSNRGQARALDRGWRIDYLLGNQAATKRFQNAWIHRPGGLTVSDHAPVMIELKG